jgi:hypothetical protein
MDRRALLRRLLVGAAGTQLAAWSGGCSVAEPYASATLLRAEWSLARAGERALLVLVVPPLRMRRQHGDAWGQLLTSGSDAGLARLAACRLVCAGWPEVRAVLGELPGMPAGPCPALLVASNGRAAPVRVDLDLAPWSPGDGPEENVARHHERVARMEAALAGVLGDAAGDPDRVRAEAPSGAAWATTWGCGFEVEGHPEQSSRVFCGMAFAPEIARRFLHYLVASDRS